jgi:hypothetical protein
VLSSGPSDLAGRFRFRRLRAQFRVPCQVPLQRSPEMMPRQDPAPLLRESWPPPLALDAPTETLTATAPARLTEPETLPPPADETRLPMTVKGTL